MSQQIAIGQPCTFEVIASGEYLTYQWLKNGINVTGADSDNYTIEAVEEEDEGEYCCLVRNAAGEITSEQATLTILCKYYSRFKMLHPLLCLISSNFLKVHPVSKALTETYKLYAFSRLYK